MLERLRLKTPNTRTSMISIPSAAPGPLARFPKGGYIRERLTLREDRLPRKGSMAKFSIGGIEVGVIHDRWLVIALIIDYLATKKVYWPCTSCKSRRRNDCMVDELRLGANLVRLD